MSTPRLALPALRGRIGDWVYYATLMRFRDVAMRVSLATEVHKSKGLRELIQRSISPRTVDIIRYIREQEQRFFNSLILGIYGGKPSWQEIEIEGRYKNVSEKTQDYLNRTFGLLTLSGKEKIFAIDGQHRSKAISDLCQETKEHDNEEISVIFVAHRTDSAGVVRTRRLFSTLNRYARPVNTSEIIALDEEDNCAIVTRNIVDESKLLAGKVLFRKTRSMPVSDKDHFTNIVVLYDLVKRLLTDENVYGIPVSGESVKSFTQRRANDEIIAKSQKAFESIFKELVNAVAPLRKFFSKGKVNRTDESTSLLFRPIGQNICFDVLKVCIDRGVKRKALRFFGKNTFNVKNDVWRKIFWDEEFERIKTEKALQRFATQLILRHIGEDIAETAKDRKILGAMQIDPRKI
jgi:DNA sulfur modification protein DndB